MAVARVVCGALFWVPALAPGLACGERSGDPIVQLPAAPVAAGTAGAASAGTAGSAAPPRGGAGASDDGGAQSNEGNDESGPTGLCGGCTSSDECGDANDACIRHQDERFCGRDCDDQRRCPDGYACVELDNSQLWQCVPQLGCPVPTEPVPALSELRRNLLARINAERASLDRPPLQASSCLDELAQGSALAFARTDEPLGKFVKECDPVWPNCACNWSAEAELTVARYDLDWESAVETAVVTTRDGQNERFTQGFLNFEGTDVGIGFWLSGDEAWIALSFR